MNMTRLLDEIHPGEILSQDFMRPMGIAGQVLASSIDVSKSRLSRIVNGSRSISADTALRLGLFFSMEPRFWMNLQAEYDLRMMKRHMEAKIAPRIRVHQMAAP